MTTIECSFGDKTFGKAEPPPIRDEDLSTFLSQGDVPPDIWEEFERHNQGVHNGRASLVLQPKLLGFC